MKILISPIEGGEVVECDSMLAAHEASIKLGEQGHKELSITRVDCVCDFCSTPEIEKLYQAEPGAIRFTIYDETRDAEIHHADGDGKWGACTECAKLIDACLGMTMSEEEALTIALRSLNQRAYENGVKLGLLPESEGLALLLISNAILDSHRFFFIHWNGEAGKPLLSDEEIMGGG